MEKDAQSRVDTAVPNTDATEHLTEEQKRALELGGQVEHSQGEQRNRVAKDADELTDR